MNTDSTHKQALILIDLQLDYFPDGRLPLANSEAAVARARELLELFRARGWPVFHIRQQSVHPNASFLVAGSPGTEIHPAVAPLPGERVIDKHTPNAFAGTPLADELRALGIADLVFGGMMTLLCVDASVRHARDLGFRCTLVEDACAARELGWRGHTVAAGDVQAAFLAALAMGYADVVTASTLTSAPKASA